MPGTLEHSGLKVYGARGLASELAGYTDDFEPIPERVSYVWE